MIQSKQTGLYGGLLLVSTGLFVVALGPGLFGASELAHFSWQHQAFSMLCHQDPARSYTLNGSTMAVCARCIGIYGAFLGGVLLMPVISWFFQIGTKLSIQLLFGAILLNFVDVIANAFGVWTNTSHSRFLLGILFGITAALMLTNSFFKNIKNTED